MTDTPNTGYYMPDYAYFDWLEERGWCVDELKECEDWCYPFGHWIEIANGTLGEGFYGRYRGIFDFGCAYYAEIGLGSTIASGFGARVMSLLGVGCGDDWWLYQ